MGIKKKLPGVRENVSLAGLTTFKIGGPARYFFVAKTKKDLIKAIKTAQELKLPFFVMGDGSNILAEDKGFPGLIIRVQTLNFKLKNSKINAESGVKLSNLVGLSMEKSLAGLEWAVGIPGTLGGAVLGNAGAFNLRMGDIIESVLAFDVKTKKTRIFYNKECEFSNKNSIFRTKRNLIILSAVLSLKRGEKKEMVKKIKEYLAHRKNNHPLGYPSAGCIFKNIFYKITNKKLLKEFPELEVFDRGARIPAAYMIEKCGLKGKRIGGAEISEKHANFILNLGRAKAEDVVKLIKLAKKKVNNKFGIKLEEEIQYL